MENDLYCPYCGSLNTYETDITLDGNFIQHCNDCGRDFIVEEV